MPSSPLPSDTELLGFLSCGLLVLANVSANNPIIRKYLVSSRSDSSLSAVWVSGECSVLLAICMSGLSSGGAMANLSRSALMLTPKLLTAHCSASSKVSNHEKSGCTNSPFMRVVGASPYLRWVSGSLGKIILFAIALIAIFTELVKVASLSLA